MYSIKNNNKYEETIKYSKFISLIYRVYTKEEVKEYLNKTKENYPSATHYCYGYVIDNDIKSSDDNEPSKTAGIPILNQIINNKLNYTLIIVVRYFGGVKLGVGPLTRAYAKVAREVITPNNIITLTKGYDINITFTYNDIKNIDYLLKDSYIINRTFKDKITYNVIISKDILDKLNNYNITINKETYIEKEEIL